ncbi:MAG: flavodoxin family protein [Candidatus Eremiobacteraeota bacterium]|nr:flavodoxin family protein [Candidatus Eremiobacteraeota bacterium]
MKKIFAFIGSPLKEKSNTYNLTKMMLDKLVKMDGEITYEILTAGHVHIKYCTGCWSCMTKGFCPLDSTDDMGGIRQKMMDADFIIMGSPVYTMSVSGQMKTLLDRFCAWYHLFKLAGKPGMTVATTAGSGLEEVHDLLEMLMTALGIKSVTRLETYAYFPGIYRDPESARKKAEEAAEIVYPYITGEKQVESDEFFEECFKIMKNKVTMGARWLAADYKYWEEHGFLELSSYAKLLEKERENE